MFKHCLLTLVLMGLAYTFTPSAFAQNSGSNDQQAAPADEQHEHGRGHFDPARRTEMLTRQLKLTSGQQSKVLDILKSAQSKMETLRSDSSLSREDRQSKMMEIHKDSDNQIRALLDADQQKKWDAMQSRREQRQEHRQNSQSAPNSPPQQ